MELKCRQIALFQENKKNNCTYHILFSCELFWDNIVRLCVRLALCQCNNCARYEFGRGMSHLLDVQFRNRLWDLGRVIWICRHFYSCNNNLEFKSCSRDLGALILAFCTWIHQNGTRTWISDWATTFENDHGSVKWQWDKQPLHNSWPFWNGVLIGLCLLLCE